MIVVMRPDATEENIQTVIKTIEYCGLKVHLSQGSEVTIIGVIGDKSKLSKSNLELLEGVDKLVPVTESYKLSNKNSLPVLPLLKSEIAKLAVKKSSSWLDLVL